MKRRLLPFIRSLTISGIVFAVGYAISLEHRAAGILFLALYSTFMVVRAYRKPIPLGFLTALLPGLMASISYAIQSSVMDYGDSNLPLFGMLLGLVPGTLMGAGHRVYAANGRIWARKGFLYLLLWGVSYLITQVAALAGVREISGGALALSGFTTSSLAVLSLFLAAKYRRGKREFFSPVVSSAAISLLLLPAFIAMAPESSNARKTTARDAEEALSLLVAHGDIVRHFPGFGNSREERWNLDHNPLFGKPGNPDSSAELKYVARNVGRLQLQLWAGGEPKLPALLKEIDRDSDPLNREWYPHRWVSGNVFVCAAHGDSPGGSYQGHAYVEYGPWFLEVEYDDYSESADVLGALRRFATFLEERLVDIEYERNGGGAFAVVPPGGGKKDGSGIREVADAGAAAALIQLLAAAIMAAAASGASTGAGAAGTAEDPGYEDLNRSGETLPSTRLADPDTGEPLPEEKGRYLVWGRWVDADEAARWVRERESARAARSAEIDRRFADERAERQAQADADHRARGDRYDAADGAWYTAGHDQARLAEARQAARKRFSAEMLEKNRNHAADRLRGMLAAEGIDAGVVDAMIAAGQWDDVCSMFRDRVYRGIKDSVAQHAAERRWETAAQVGEYAATVVENASKASIAALAGGPAWIAAGGSALTGMGAAAVATGAIGAAGETTSAVLDAEEMLRKTPITRKNRLDVAYDISTHVAKGFGAGFVSGAKDGAIGVYCGRPGLGKSVKILLPAAGDFVETGLRTGDLSKAAKTGALSAAGEYLGGKIDGIHGRMAREAAGTALSAVSGGAGSYINGGDFGEGAIKGIAGRVGSKLGDAVARGRSDPRHLQNPEDAMEAGAASDRSAADGEAESGLRKALDDAAAERNRTIPIEDQPEIIQKLHESMRDVEDADPATGRSRIVKKVDPKLACDQLRDTASSRLAKQADPELREAMIRTRQEDLYDPPARATIERVAQKPEVRAMMRPGDRLVLEGYSTPGSTPSLGADRDGILCILRADPKTGNVQRIQLDGKHWHDTAYEEFHKHTIQYANRDGNGNITPETEPDYHRRLEELDYLKKRPLDRETIDRVHDQVRQKVNAQIAAEDLSLKESGRPPVGEAERQARIQAGVKSRIDRLNRQFLSEDQVRARAWAASRNQVFTDPYHVEASRDNSNQALAVVTAPDGTRKVERVELGVEVDGTVRPIRDAFGEVRTGPGMVEGQSGSRRGMMDSEAATGMWKGKSGDYVDGNLPEALAQTQKGIVQQIKFIDGQRRAGIPVPPLKAHDAEAMTILSDPGLATADPDTLRQADAQLRSILKEDGTPAYPGGIREAIEKIPEQNRVRDLAIRAQGIPAQGPPAPAEPEDGVTDASETVRTAEGPLASDANRSGMRHGISNPRTDDLEERIRRLEEERDRLARRIAERDKGPEGGNA
jgi:hypothetical protein